MKKLTAFALALVCVLGLVGCDSQTYQVPHDQFCYAKANSQEVDIPSEGRQYIIDLLNEATWREGTSNCSGEYLFYTQKQELHYHAECGTFIDVTSHKKTTLPNDERIEVNNLLGFAASGTSESDTEQPKPKFKLDIEYPDSIANQLESEYEAGEEVTVILPMVTDCCPAGYVNSVRQNTEWDDFGCEYFTFIMPCEDVFLEVKYEGSWGRCYFPHLPHPDWLHSLVCEEG